MALFLRREIQRRIEEVAAFVPSDKLDGLVRRLNLDNKQAIEAQWEFGRRLRKVPTAVKAADRESLRDRGTLRTG